MQLSALCRQWWPGIAALLLGVASGIALNVVAQSAPVKQSAMVLGDFAAVVAREPQPMVIFTQSTCPHCTQAVAWLDRHAIRYVRLETDSSASAQARFEALQGAGVPLAYTADRRVLGFSEALYTDAFSGLRRHGAGPSAATQLKRAESSTSTNAQGVSTRAAR